MQNKFSRILAALFVIFSGVLFIEAQTRAVAYTDGENLFYEGKLNKIIPLGVDIATLNFKVSESTDKKNFLVTAEAISKGSLTKLLGFKFYQRILTTVDAETLSVLRTIKRDEQGDRIRNSIADFVYTDKTVTYIENDPNNTARPPYRIASTIEPETYDLVSAIFSVRRMPLTIGKMFTLNVSDSGLVYKVPVRVTGREKQNTAVGKVICFVIEPDIFGAGKMIEQKGSMKIWITDDLRRIPVRSQINTSIGRVEVKLKKFEVRNETAAAATATK